jgi:hypothetical protein
MDEREIEREIDALLEGEMAKRRADLRMEIIMRERRKAFNAHMDHINRPRPDLERARTPQEQAWFDGVADESQRRNRERIEKNEERYQREEKQRAEALRARTAKPLPSMQTGGSEGLEIRRR